MSKPTLDSLFENEIYNDSIILKKEHSDFSEYMHAVGGALFDDYKLFIKKYNAFPHHYSISNLNLKKVKIAFEEKYKDLIEDTTLRSDYRWKSKSFELIEKIYFLTNKCLISFENSRTSCINLHFDSNSDYQIFLAEFVAFCAPFKKKTKNKSTEINLIIKGSYGFELTSVNINKLENDLDLNYNDDFMEVNSLILENINTKNQKGLYLFHGEPGTGKTSYLRWLITKVTKKVMFVAPHIAENITNPEFIDLLISNPNSILIIEDAERIISDRNQNSMSTVSVLLNIADGLLADCLNTQIICTFNTKLSKIDDALLRKGRLTAKYEFKALTETKSQILSDKLGFKNKILKESTLAEIYNQNSKNFNETVERKIGF